MSDLTFAAYGKHGIRMLSWTEKSKRAAVRDLSIDLDVEGDFDDSYLSGENHQILPTDTYRRHLLAECSENPTTDIETFLLQAGRRVLAANPVTRKVTIKATERMWRATGNVSFFGESLSTVSTVTIEHDQKPLIETGIEGLEMLSIAGNGFSGFLRDDLTVQADAFDRPMLGRLDAYWKYANSSTAKDCAASVQHELLKCLADRPSKSVQDFLTATGQHMLKVIGDLQSIKLLFTATGVIEIDCAGRAVKEDSAYEVLCGSNGVTKVELSKKT